MKHVTLLLLCCFAILQGYAQSGDWSLVSSKNMKAAKKELVFRKNFPQESKIYTFNYANFSTSLVNNAARGVRIINLPTPNGVERFSIKETSALAPELSAKYPMVKSYVGYGVENLALVARFSIGTDGLHAVVYNAGETSFYIDPYTKDNNSYITYKREDLDESASKFECAVKTQIHPERQAKQQLLTTANDGKLRTFRIAIACSGEYAEFHLNNQNVAANATVTVKKAAVLSAMNTSMTRVNGIYERDLGVTMQIVADNDKIIFLDADNDEITDGDADLMIDEVQTICDDEIGTANYDIGHIFSIGGAGLAGGGVVCIEGSKANGVTGISSPIGDFYDVDYVAHEIGHQFGANHTQNNDCNRVDGSAVEPGSASTIMGYAGICSPNVQNRSHDNFHAISIQEMWNIIQSSASCAVVTSTGNTAPEVSAGADVSIPKSTPFVLKGIASDVDTADVLTYSWEQTDAEIATMPPVATSTSGPAFRALPIATTPNRYMPALATVIGGNTASEWEVVPSVARDLNFAFIVRDNHAGGGNTNRDDIKVSVVDATPFVVNSPATAVAWTGGSTQTITWTVGQTNVAPINEPLVDIKLSTDGGVTFPITLASRTANDGTESVVIPNNATANARIMVAAADNIFYNVNAVNFTINEGTASVKNFTFKGFNLFPNPSKGTFNLKLDLEDTLKVTVQLLDLTGRLIGERNFFNNSTKFAKQISFSKASKGLYLVKIINGNQQATKKLLIE